MYWAHENLKSYLNHYFNILVYLSVCTSITGSNSIFYHINKQLHGRWVSKIQEKCDWFQKPHFQMKLCELVLSNLNNCLKKIFCLFSYVFLSHERFTESKSFHFLKNFHRCYNIKDYHISEIQKLGISKSKGVLLDLEK